MNIYGLLQVLAGLSFFLYGMNVMSSSLEKMAGGKLESTLKKVTSNKFLSFLFGLLITVAIQSSSGALVMLVGLVNSGIIMFEDTLPIILGTNVGTTITGWILTLTSVGDQGFSLLSLLNPKVLSPVLAFVGTILRMSAKKDKHKDIGTIFIGFAILMYGMSFMSEPMQGLAEEEWFANALVMFSNPILAATISMIFTGVIQSSAATVGIVEAFALSGAITFKMAVALIVGANVGTCVTALISAMGANKHAKRVAVLKVLMNASAGIIVLAALILMPDSMEILSAPVSVFHVALIHTLFNIFITILGFTFEKPYIYLTKKLVRDNPDDLPEILLDERLLNSGAIAVSEAMNNTVDMCYLAQEQFELAFELLDHYNDADFEKVRKMEKKIDWYDDELNSFLIKLSRVELSQNDGENVNKMLHVITDIERIGDHGYNIATMAKEMAEGGVSFSQEALHEIEVLRAALKEIVKFAVDAFAVNDLASAAQVEPLEEVIDNLTDKAMNHHINRLQKGECSIEASVYFTDLLTNCERVSDHCSNVAVCVIEVSDDEFYTHQYLMDIKQESDVYKSLYKYYKDQYTL